MQLRYSKNYIKGIKELKKKHKTEELNTLEKIIKLIKRSNTYDLLKNTPLAYLYDFEELKDNLTGYFSFRLSKKKSPIRLIGRYQDNIIIIQLVYISMEHYNDFNPKGVIFDDE